MQRLKTRAQFQAVMAAGVCARTPHFVLHCLALEGAAAAAAASSQDTSGPGNTPQALFVVGSRRRAAPDGQEPTAAQSGDRAGDVPPGIWVGPLVPKRWARRSVTRHLLRRQVYAVAAEFADRLPAPVAYVVRLRAEFDRKHFVSASSEPLRRAIRAELQRLFGHAARMTQPADAAVQQREATP